MHAGTNAPRSAVFPISNAHLHANNVEHTMLTLMVCKEIDASTTLFDISQSLPLLHQAVALASTAEGAKSTAGIQRSLGTSAA